MTEQEVIDFIIQERINQTLAKTGGMIEMSQEESQKKIIEAEKIIDKLPEYERKIIVNYINDLFNDVALNEVLLYKKGFTDGVKTMKRLLAL